jgi:hypothetical protein
MSKARDAVRRLYGAHPLHLLILLGCFALVGYVVIVLGPGHLWNSKVWWKSILVWFIGAFVLHDLVLFPFYAVADRSLAAGLRAVTGRLPTKRSRVSPVNYFRVPILGSGLLFLLFFPGIVRQGRGTYHAATGLTQQPFLDRWLLITAALFGMSAIVYSIRWLLSRAEQPESVCTPDEAGS